MYSIIDAALSRARTMLSLLALILVAGVSRPISRYLRNRAQTLPSQLSMFRSGTKGSRQRMQNVYWFDLLSKSLGQSKA